MRGGAGQPSPAWCRRSGGWAAIQVSGRDGQHRFEYRLQRHDVVGIYVSLKIEPQKIRLRKIYCGVLVRKVVGFAHLVVLSINFGQYS